MPSPSRWWCGVAPFPVVVLTAVLSRFAGRRFANIAIADTLTQDEALAGFAAFALSVLASWLGVLVALVVLVCLALDVRALRGSDADAWTPSRAWGLAGLAHLLGALFAPVLVVSVPALSLYLYRRRERVGAP